MESGPGSLMQFLALKLVPRSLAGTFLRTSLSRKCDNEIDKCIPKWLNKKEFSK
jgi:hypothetical protein